MYFSLGKILFPQKISHFCLVDEALETAKMIISWNERSSFRTDVKSWSVLEFQQNPEFCICIGKKHRCLKRDPIYLILETKCLSNVFLYWHCIINLLLKHTFSNQRQNYVTCIYTCYSVCQDSISFLAFWHWELFS